MQNGCMPTEINEKINQTTENLQDGFFMLNHDWQFTDVNCPAATLFRKTYEELIGKNLWDVLPHLKNTDLASNFHHVMEKHSFKRMEMISTISGRWINLAIHPCQDGISVSWQDIHEQKRIEEALRESEGRFRVLIDSLALAVWETDAAGQVTTKSPSWRALTGQTDEAFSGSGWLDAVHPEDRDRTNEKWYNALATGCKYDVEYRVKNVNDAWVWTHAFAAPIYDAQGTIVKWIGLNIDITQRKMTEASLRKSEELSRAMIEKLQEANNNKSQFLSILSHELRNPLASIIMGLNLLKKLPRNGEKADKAIEIVELIERQTVQLNRLVDDLLDVTRLERHRIKLKVERLELNNLVSQTIDDQRSMFTEKEISLQVRLAEDPIYLDADPVRLTQVIDNLLHNAAKFTANGGMTQISVDTDEARAEAVVKIQDSGIGIDPGLSANLFKPFMQADKSLDRSYGGLGLGLVISKGIVELHGGLIEATSEGLGCGTIVTIRLPLAKADKQATDGDSTSGQELSSARRILLIEDNQDLVTILCELLETMGHVVKAEFNGLDGISTAKLFKPDVVICDIGLPGMSGFDVARNLRNDPEFKEITLIAFSGYAQADVIEQSTAAGFDRHLVKPVDVNTLKKILSESNSNN